jgi:hypothetical protein
MYIKKIFMVLVVLFSLTGCKEGSSDSNSDARYSKLTGVHEYDYFPVFPIAENRVNHTIRRFCTSKSQCDDIVENFKLKGAYDSGISGNFYRGYPLRSGHHVKSTSIGSYAIHTSSNNIEYYTLSMTVSIKGSSIARDKKFFETLFGDTNATVDSIMVDKEFLGDIMPHINSYISKLESQGFKKTQFDGQWTKEDKYTFYTWQYGLYTINKMPIYNVNWFVVSKKDS